MPNKLEQLKAMTDVVADTGDLTAIEKFHPIDATTNPSLLLKAAQLPRYAPLCDAAWVYAQEAQGQAGDSQQQLDQACDRLAVLIGREISGIIPGRVSTEVDARLSFDSKATIARAHHLIAAYEELGVNRDRILIKIAATWEGIAAAAELEHAGVNCNLTLLFGFEQALACADAGVFLISPFVGRIFDWYTKSTGEIYTAETDPGVISVRKIYDYYKNNGYDTVIMGASFRNIGQIEALAGCDRLTISPNLLAELEASNAPLVRRLGGASNNLAATKTSKKVAIGENEFRWQHTHNAMATEKLAEGIRAFAADQIKLEARLRAGSGEVT